MRVQRNAIVCGAAMIGVAAIGWGWASAAAVLAGGLLAALSFLLIKSGIVGLTAPLTERPRDPARRPDMGFAVAKLVGRYALLAFLAYVMIARLRLHPLGLLAGASSVVAGAAIEAGRFLRKHI